MDDSRRDFLKKAGVTALGLSCFPLLGAAAGALKEHQGSSHGHGRAPAETQRALIIDLKKCNNPELIKACGQACRDEHNIPVIDDPEKEIKWIWGEKYRNVFSEQAHLEASEKVMEQDVIVMCNHCTHPSCVRVCPTKATFKRESDGIVLMDMHRCIGCRFCMAACPYGARSFNFYDPGAKLENGEETSKYPRRMIGVVEKCTFCAERLRVGKEPACVEKANEIVPGAMIFGQLKDKHIKEVLENEHTICRGLSLGTGPNVFYKV